MKIGIVTHPLLGNYGGILQNFALQQVLKKLGYSPITIDYLPYTTTLVGYILASIKSLLLFFTPKRRRFRPYRLHRSKPFDSFVQNHIVLTKTYANYTSSVINEYQLDALITGSDQVWRPMYVNDIDAMFLGFAESNSIKKISYAASFGVDTWEYSEEETKHCKKLAHMLDVVTVRESSGVKLCKQYLDVEATEVLDPTLLLDKEDYNSICAHIPMASESFLASYVLDLTPEKQNYIERIAVDLGLPLKIFGVDQNMTLSVEEWLAMFRDASFIITDSFHGSVFSLIYNKPFIAIGNGERGLSRFYSLLDKFSLSGRLVTSLASVDLFSMPLINWEHVNDRRKALKDLSLRFLQF